MALEIAGVNRHALGFDIMFYLCAQTDQDPHHCVDISQIWDIGEVRFPALRKEGSHYYWQRGVFGTTNSQAARELFASMHYKFIHGAFLFR
jgi:hypothetical protein